MTVCLNMKIEQLQSEIDHKKVVNLTLFRLTTPKIETDH